jgi:beta-RFAP synthase
MTTIHVSTPSRLHFGLLRLDEGFGRRFGGLGMMVDQPHVELALVRSSQWRVAGPGARRARQFAESASAATGVRAAPLRIRLKSVIPAHRGLGGGTQLALAIAAGVRELAGQSRGDAATLAAAVGRGARSAVGSHGFVHGGLIWERGRTADAGLAELADRVAVPASWRFVLIAPKRRRGLSGRAERAAFGQLPPVPDKVVCRLASLAEEHILPAARDARLDDFGEAVYEYGRLSGESFAAVQGGPYASDEIAACVEAVRACGVAGAGQTSWGPTVFAATTDDGGAAALVERMQSDRRWADHEFRSVGPDNRGATVRREAPVAPQQETSAGAARR